MPFRFTYGDESWVTDHLLIDEAIAVEEASGEPWLLMNPFRNLKAAKAILVAFLRRTRDEQQTAAIVAGLDLKQLLDMIDRVDDDRPASYEGGLPLEAKGEPGTSTSSGSPESTPGLPTS